MTVAFSNLDKPLWPAAGFTKGDLVDYYRRVAPALLPHLRGRPVTLRRFPDGVEADGWFQHTCPPGAPSWLRTRAVAWPTGTVWEFCALDDLRSLLWVANLATIELHPFFLVADRPEEPTAVVFDLDPGAPADLRDCCRVGLRLRAALEEDGLAAFPKVSGSVGLHVVVPLNCPHAWADAKAYARTLARRLAAAAPEEVVAHQRRADRAGRVLVDWLQNDPMRSTVAPYSLRSFGWPTVSAPVAWEEVEAAAAGASLVFEPASVLERLERLGDLHAPVLELAQRLPR